MLTITGNTFSDFPPDQFTILAFCESCGHRAAVDRSSVPEDSIVQDLTRRLRCAECGSRDCSTRIVFTGRVVIGMGEENEIGGSAAATEEYQWRVFSLFLICSFARIQCSRKYRSGPGGMPSSSLFSASSSACSIALSLSRHLSPSGPGRV